MFIENFFNKLGPSLGRVLVVLGLGLIGFYVLYLTGILDQTKSLRHKKKSYEDIKDDMYNTLRVSAISQRMYHVSKENTIEKHSIGPYEAVADHHKKLVKYYDDHLAQEQARVMRRNYAYRLLLFMIIEVGVLMRFLHKILFGGYTLAPNTFDLMKYIGVAIFLQIAGMVYLIVQYLFPPNKKHNNDTKNQDNDPKKDQPPSSTV